MIKQAIVIVFALLIPSVSTAALVIFNDRTAWRAAAGGGVGDLSENFNSFAVDTLYGGGNPAISSGFLTLDMNVCCNDLSWRIEATADGITFPSLPDVDGTPYAVTIGYAPGSRGTLLTFPNIGAIGFDYKDASYSTDDGILTTSLGDSYLKPIQNSPDTFFLGLLYTEGEVFNSLLWADGPGIGIGHGFSMDNVEAYSSVAQNPIPVPAAIWLFSTALIGLVGLKIRKKTA